MFRRLGARCRIQPDESVVERIIMQLRRVPHSPCPVQVRVSHTCRPLDVGWNSIAYELRTRPLSPRERSPYYTSYSSGEPGVLSASLARVGIVLIACMKFGILLGANRQASGDLCQPSKSSRSTGQSWKIRKSTAFAMALPSAILRGRPSALRNGPSSCPFVNSPKVFK